MILVLKLVVSNEFSDSDHRLSRLILAGPPWPPGGCDVATGEPLGPSRGAWTVGARVAATHERGGFQAARRRRIFLWQKSVRYPGVNSRTGHKLGASEAHTHTSYIFRSSLQIFEFGTTQNAWKAAWFPHNLMPRCRGFVR